MNDTEANLLAVALCAKRFGVAIFHGQDLIYFAVKTLKTSRANEKAETEIWRAIRSLIIEFSPQTVIIKALGKHQIKSIGLPTAMARIKRELASLGINTEEILLEDAERALCPHDKPIKKIAFKNLSAVYPELKQFVAHQSPWQTEYYNSLLSAVAISFYYQNKSIEERNGRKAFE